MRAAARTLLAVKERPVELLELADGRRGRAATPSATARTSTPPPDVQDIQLDVETAAGRVARGAATSPPLDRSTSRWVRSRLSSCA